MGNSSHGPPHERTVAVGILTHKEGRVLVGDERRNALKTYVVFTLGAIARPIRPLTGSRLWMGRLLGGLFSHAGGTDALRKARQRSRTVGGPMGPALFATSGPMGHKRHEGPEVPTVTIHRPCWLLSITHACCQEPVQAEETGRTNKDRRDLNNRAIAHYYPSPFAQVRKKDPCKQ